MNAAEACRLLAQEGLVKWSCGNASERVETCMFIKPSGTPCSQVGPLSRVRLLDGRHDLALRPSTDADAHRYIYNHLPEVSGIVHTHSTFATAFALAGLSIPCVATAVADEFGCDVPVSEYCVIGGEDIGKEVVRLHEITDCPAILIRQHGVFCVGHTVEAAVKSAVMLEDCAKTVWHAMQFSGSGCKRLPDSEVAANHKRYSEAYGQ